MISPSPSEFLQDTAMSSRNLGQTFQENSVERLIKIIRQRTTTCERAPSLSRCDTPNLTTAQDAPTVNPKAVGSFSDCCTSDSNIKSAVEEHENGQTEGFILSLDATGHLCEERNNPQSTLQ